MKNLVTRKKMKESYSNIIKIPYCNAQFLLRNINPFAYSTMSEGWACDYYIINCSVISTGYAPIGNKVDFDLLQKYENQAQKIWCDYSIGYEEQRRNVSDLLDEFISRVTV